MVANLGSVEAGAAVPLFSVYGGRVNNTIGPVCHALDKILAGCPHYNVAAIVDAFAF